MDGITIHNLDDGLKSRLPTHAFKPGRSGEEGAPGRDDRLLERTKSAVANMDKRSFCERDIDSKFYAPTLRQAGSDEMLQIGKTVRFNKGRIILHGKLVSRGQAQRADSLIHAFSRSI